MVLRQECEGDYFGIGGWPSARAVATDNSVSRIESASDAIGERNRSIAVPLSAHRPRPPRDLRWYRPAPLRIKYHQTLMRDVQVELSDAPPYVVTCLERDDAAGVGHDHVTAVETSDPDGGRTRWATVEVIKALLEGHSFVADEAGNHVDPGLAPSTCGRCGAVTLSVSPGGTEIAPCAWLSEARG